MAFCPNSQCKLKMKNNQSSTPSTLKTPQINAELRIQKDILLKTLVFQEAFLNELFEYEQGLNLTAEIELAEMKTLLQINESSSTQMQVAKQRYEQEERNYEELEREAAVGGKNDTKALLMAREKTETLRKEERRKAEEIELLERQRDQIEAHKEILRRKIESEVQQNSEMEKRVREMEEENRRMERFIEETYINKKRLNNELQELRGSIRVYCRVRPMLNSADMESTYELVNENTLKLNVPRRNFKSENHQNAYSYNFQQIFNEKQTQAQIFDQLAQLIQSAADGKKVCIFAYGQTGSGKTFTMQGGPNQQRGIIPRSIDLIFEEVCRARQYSWQYSVGVSIQEVYLDSVRDLLGSTGDDPDNIIEVHKSEEVHLLLDTAAKNRKVAETNCNEHSSRSHLIFTIHLRASNAEKSLTRKGSLNLVDLAGSERVGESGVVAERMKETQAINKSLTQLGVVISAMAKKQSHIPFRNSKLTHLLQRYLEGDSKTLMFVNISPRASDFNQTLCSLRFADKVKECKLKK